MTSDKAQLSLFDKLAGRTRPPIVVSNGYGLDSMAVLVGFARRGIVPDLILHADTGSEKDDTLAYIPHVENYLALHGFPPTTIVRYQPKDYKHWPEYYSLEENLLTNITYPSIAYGGHSCSVKWKITPMNKFLRSWQPAIDCWSSGQKVIKVVGYDAGTRDSQRCSTFQAAEDKKDFDLFDFWYPLREWGWDRERCAREVISEGLPLTPKSSCYFCTAMKPHEVDALSPDKLRRIVMIEARAQWRQRSNEGLWRSTVKGFRGATPKPGSMSKYIRDKGLLPAEEIDRIIAATPTAFLHKGDIPDWKTFIRNITDPQPLAAAA